MKRDPEAGIEPPHWHDVGSVPAENSQRLPNAGVANLKRIIFYADDEFLPSEEYTLDDANHYIRQPRSDRSPTDRHLTPWR